MQTAKTFDNNNVNLKISIVAVYTLSNAKALVARFENEMSVVSQIKTLIIHARLSRY